ncbi:MAG: hypothetical protein QM760_04255 [Nibricoccus sp.]
MRLLLISYTVIFGLGSLVAAVAAMLPAEAGEEKESAIEHVIDGVTAAVLLSGMIFLLVGAENPFLKNTWKIIVPLIGGHQLWSSWRSRRKAIVAGEKQKDPKGVRFADVATLILLLPALAMNLFYSYR